MDVIYLHCRCSYFISRISGCFLPVQHHPVSERAVTPTEVFWSLILRYPRLPLQVYMYINKTPTESFFSGIVPDFPKIRPSYYIFSSLSFI
jgi:hypothetical protein